MFWFGLGIGLMVGGLGTLIHAIMTAQESDEKGE